MNRIPLIKPYLPDKVKDRVLQVLDSGFLTEGPVARELEEAFRSYIGCGRAVAFSSCTTGLETALRVLGVGPGDEVIVPDYTYPATAAVAAIVGATAVIVDVDPQTMLVDYEAARQAITDKTRAIIPVSIFGNPLDYDQLDELRREAGVWIVEDAACSIGATYKGEPVGRQADISVFSLHPRKFITTGEGGMAVTNSDELAEAMISYKHFGMGAPKPRAAVRFERMGTNYKLSDILAAVGVAQMEMIKELLDRRISLAEKYKELLKDHSCISIPGTTRGGKHSYQSFCIFVDNRDEVMGILRDEGIEVQIGTYALHMHEAFAPGPNCRIEGEMKGSREAFERCLTLPLYHEMTLEDQERVVSRLLELCT